MTLFPVSAMDFSSGVDYALRCLGSPEMRLKPEQIASIKGIYEGKDVFTWLPTGFGKSICYQVLPFLFDVKLCRNAGQCNNCGFASCVPNDRSS